MTPLTPTPDQRDIEARIERALAQRMTIRPHTINGDPIPGMYLVSSESDETYLVDTTERSCSCYDSEQRGVICKHYYRVTLETEFGFNDHFPRIEDTDLLKRENVAIADGGLCEECADSEPGTLLCFACFSPGHQEVRV